MMIALGWGKSSASGARKSLDQRQPQAPHSYLCVIFVFAIFIVSAIDPRNTRVIFDF
jgi:hypothetical protein